MKRYFLVALLILGIKGFGVEFSYQNGIIIESTATISSVISDKISDEKDCLAIGVAEENTVYIFKKREGGTYTLGTDSAYKITAKQPDRIGEELAVGDIDGDSDLDLIISGSETIHVVKGPIEENIELEKSLGIAVDATKIASGNVDGDEGDDVVALTAKGVLVFYSGPAGNIEESPVLVKEGSFTSLLCTDFDSDGFCDIVVGREDRSWILYGTETNIFREASIFGGDITASGNLNGGEYPDLLFGSESSIYILYGTESIAGTITLTEKIEGFGSLALCLNLDGMDEDEIVVAKDRLWLFEEKALFGSVNLTAEIIGCGEMNSDLCSDIIIGTSNKVFIIFEPFLILGSVTSEGSPLPDVRITIQQTSATATTDQSGRFIFKHLPEGTYTLILDKEYHLFEPASATLFVDRSLYNIEFVGKHLYISGVVRAEGEPVDLATVTIKETGSSCLTSENGTYTIQVSDYGAYTIITEKPYHIFETKTVVLSEGFPNRDGLEITGWHLYISGRVRADGEPTFATVTVAETGSSCLTSENGTYTIYFSEFGNYTIEVSKPYHFFETETVTISKENPNLELDLSGWHLYIKGSVTTDDRTPLLATLTLTGPETKTLISENGSYIFELSMLGQYSIKVEKPYHLFEPTQRGFTISTETPHFDHQDFVGRRCYIAGSVTTKEGEPITGATVTVNNIGSCTITDGSFWFDIEREGIYTLSVEMLGYAFDKPTSTTHHICFENPNVEIQVLGAEIYIEGTITVGTEGLSGVNVVLSLNETKTTNTDGYWRFSLLHPGDYSVKPYMFGYGFDPALYSAKIDFFNPSPTWNFSAYRLYLTGSVTTVDKEPLCGATITVTGDYATTTTTDSLGSYYIDLPGRGTYTVKIEKEGWGFFPAEYKKFDIYRARTLNFSADRLPIIISADPTYATNTGTCTITVEGGWFSSSTTAILTKEDVKIVGSFTKVSGTTTIWFCFDLYGAEPGTYSLVLTNSSYYSSTQTDCFYISYILGYIMIKPKEIFLGVGSTKTISAAVYDTCSNPLPLSCTWSTEIGSLSHSFGTETRLYADRAGTGYVWAECEGVIATASVTVIGVSRFKVTAPATQTAGEGFEITIEAIDHLGSLNTSCYRTATVCFSDPEKEEQVLYLLKGSATFTISFEKAGTQTITARDSKVSEIFGTATTLILPAEPYTLSIQKYYDVSADVGTIPLSCYLTDQFSNPIDGAIIKWSIDGDGSITATSTTNYGTATASLFSRKAGRIKVKAESDGVFGVVSCEISPGETKKITLRIDPEEGSPGEFRFSIIPEDAWRNIAHITGTASLISTYPGLSEEREIFGSLTISHFLKKAGAYIATATVDELSATATFTINPSQLSELTIGIEGEKVVAKTPFTICILGWDTYKNMIDLQEVDSISGVDWAEKVGVFERYVKYRVRIDRMGTCTIKVTAGAAEGVITRYVYGTIGASCNIETDGVSVKIGKGAFEEPYRIEIAGTTTLCPANIGISFSISAFDVERNPLSGSGTINLSISYTNTTGHKVDGTDIDERTLVILKYDSNRWQQIPSSRDIEKNIVYGTTNSLSIFALSGATGSSDILERIPVWPNPYRAWERNKHRGVITFGDPDINGKRLPSPITIRIFNAAGELIFKEEEIETDGTYTWVVGNIASGVYYYQIKYRESEVFGKIGIIR